jgi:transcriptional regulator of arginine metabolism
MVKSRRQKIIRKIVDNENIVTQSQLTEELRKRGFDVTQATVSRDIKELGLIKMVSDKDSFRYSFPAGFIAGNSLRRTKKMLRDNLLRIESSQNIIVVHSLPGTAQGIAFCLDGLAWEEILGTVAGDDTIIIILKENESAAAIIERLNNFV